MRKIQSHPNTQWRHVPSTANPADLGSRSRSVTDVQLWWRGPEWLADLTSRPEDIVTQASQQSDAERKVQREIFAAAIKISDGLDRVLEKSDLHKALRVCAWVSRFICNCQQTLEKIQGPLSTQEITACRLFWIKRAQQQGISDNHFQEDKLQLNLHRNADGVLEFRGRIQGEYPIFLPDSALYTIKVVQRAHVTTLHGGVGLTMAKVREVQWVPCLRKVTKRVLRNCWDCKRFQAVAAPRPPAGPLPRDRTEGAIPINVIGVDFTGPVKYLQRKSKKEQKAYIVIYSCSFTRAVFLELLPSLETGEFIKSLKRLIARRGSPTKIYSDNGRTFIAAANWLKKVRKDERLNAFLGTHEITWQFNLSRAPWWGGQFERLIGVMKGAFYKTVGQGQLSWDELSEVLLDVEIVLNNRPLSYAEDDIQLPTLTPNALLFIKSNILPELQSYHLKEKDLRKRAKFLQRSKDAIRRRWFSEYLRAIRERHRLKYGNSKNPLSVRDVVIFRSEERNRNHWPLGIIEKLIEGRDGVVRAAKVRTRKTVLERAIQHLYPLELSCDISNDATPLNPTGPPFKPRRDAAPAAELLIQGIANDNQ